MITCDAPSGTPELSDASGGFVGRIPERLADTRAAEAVPEGCWLRVDLPPSVPDDATAVAVTVTSDRVAAAGFLTVHPCGSVLPELSNLNVRPEGPNSNFAIVPVDDTRQVCVYSSGGTDVILDLVGHIGPGGSTFQELEPRRVVDSRDPDRRPANVTGPLNPRQLVTIDRQRLGVPVDATAVMVNLTVADATGPGFLTAYPCAGERPPTSNVNYDTRSARANTSIVALSAEGTMCLELDVSSANVIVDLVGWFGQGIDGLEYGVGMSRVADSRNGLGGWNGPFAADETRSFDPGSTRMLPDGTRVAVLGVVATRVEQPGFLQVRPCGITADVSSVNFAPGIDITNLVVVPIDDDGSICVTSSAPTDVVVDLFGGFGADGLMRSLSVGPHEVFPPLRSDIHDYVAYCPDETGNRFDVEARGMPRTRVELVGVASGSAELSTRATLAADEALRLRVIPRTGPAEEYWIRCLPPDFPRIGSVTRSPDVEPAWYLLNHGTPTAAFGIILDSNGVPVWYERGRPGPPGLPVPEPRGLQRLADGSLAWFQALGFPFGIDPENAFERFSLDGTNVRRYRIDRDGDATNHHELLELDNGNVMVTSMPLSEAPPGTQCNAPVPGVPGQFQLVDAQLVSGALVQEIRPDGSVAWEWDADPVRVDPELDDAQRILASESTVPLCFVHPTLGNIRSLIHPNALAVRGDQVLVSARHADAIYAIDRETKEVAWKLGGTARDAVSLPLLGQSPTRLGRQHDVQVLPNGNITVFDNRTAFPFAPIAGPARFVEYRIDEQPGSRSATVVRQVRRANGDNSGALGSARVQPDGGVVIGWGSVPGPVFTEVDADGEVLFEVSLDGSRFSYRVIKEPLDAFDLDQLRATAGGALVVP